MAAKQVKLTVIYDLVSRPHPRPSPPDPLTPFAELSLLSHRAEGNLQRYRRGHPVIQYPPLPGRVQALCPPPVHQAGPAAGQDRLFTPRVRRGEGQRLCEKV